MLAEVPACYNVVCGRSGFGDFDGSAWWWSVYTEVGMLHSIECWSLDGCATETCGNLTFGGGPAVIPIDAICPCEIEVESCWANEMSE